MENLTLKCIIRTCVFVFIPCMPGLREDRLHNTFCPWQFLSYKFVVSCNDLKELILKPISAAVKAMPVYISIKSTTILSIIKLGI